MTLWHAAAPLLLALALAEYLAGRRSGRVLFRSRDTLADIGCAVLSQVAGLAVAAVTIGGYRLAAESLHAAGWAWSIPWQAGGLAAWIVVFVLVDLGQYLVHRLSHRVSLLWACHAVHHSSGELNYAVAIRNSSFHGLFIWIFFLPGAVLGIPWPMIGVCYGINVLYQFLLHTRVVDRLGPLEHWLNTPSHHRVHHGRDPKYLDRNFGGVLIVWDRWFGTFQAEEEEPCYGPALPSWNPVWANLHGFAQIREACRAAPGLRGALAAALGPPERLPEVASPTGPAVSARTSAWVASQLALAIIVTLGVVLSDRWTAEARGGAAALVVATVGTGGALLDGHRWAWRIEGCRLLVVALLVACTVL